MLSLLQNKMFRIIRAKFCLLRPRSRKFCLPVFPIMIAQTRLRGDCWKLLKDQGWRTVTEHELAEGRRTDILVNDRVAIEVEMGKSEIVENVKKNLEAGFDVIVVSTQQAISSVKDKLAKQGLGQTRVVLPNQVALCIKERLTVTAEVRA